MKNLLLPPRILRANTVEERLQIDTFIKSDDKIANKWFEKFRRFASIYGRRLKSISKKRFGKEYKSNLKWIIKWLIFASEQHDNKLDHSYLNAILYCNDAIENIFDKEIEIKLKNLFDNKINKNNKISNDILGNEIEFTNENFSYSGKKKSIVIFAPSPYSHFAIIVLDQLIKLNLVPSLIVVKKFTLNRFLFELKRDGLKIIAKKIWRKLILKSNENNSPDTYGTMEILKDINIKENNIKNISEKNNIKYQIVNNFSEIDKNLDEIIPDYGIFAGGGMINNSTIEKFNNGIINVHMGPLPQYRGMDVVQAPILDGNYKDVGLSAHFIDKTLDGGDVLAKMTFDSRQYKNIESLRNELSAAQPVLALYSILSHIDNKIVPMPQLKRNGKQYYFIHPKLNIILNKIMLSFFKINIEKKIFNNLIKNILII